MKNSMYTIIRSCIDRGEFKLGDIIPRIRAERWNDLLTDAERDELIELAHEKVNPSKEAPAIMDIIQKLIERMDKMESTLKSVIAPEQPEDSETPEGSDQPEQPTPPSYEKWTAWDGLSKNYQKGSIVEHNGKLWESTFEGQNVWEPGAPGIDARYWVEYIGTSDTEETGSEE